MKYTKELLQPLVANSESVADVLRKLGCRCNGSIHAHIKKLFVRYELDTTHFKGCGHAKGKPNNKKRPWQKILVKRNNLVRQKSYFLRRALTESGVEYRCSTCGIDTWNNQPITLQVNHKNGDISDDRRKNLEFLCPNCHSQTTHWCAAWKGKLDSVVSPPDCKSGALSCEGSIPSLPTYD